MKTSNFAAIGYIRVSTEEQASSGVGMADQRLRITAYCGLRGLNLVRIIEDGGASGGKLLASRPGGEYNRLEHRAARG